MLDEKDPLQVENGHIEIAYGIADALMRTNMSAYQYRILWAIWRKTYGWKKKEDWVAHSQIVKMTGISKGHVSRAIKELKLRNILVTCLGNKLAFNKYWQGWIELPNGVRGDKKVTQLGNKIDVSQCKKKDLPTLSSSKKSYPIGKKVTRSGKKVTRSGGNKRNLTKETLQKKKYIWQFCEQLLKNCLKTADRKSSISSIFKLLTLTDDKVGEYPELKIGGKDLKNIVKERFQILWNCQKNYKKYCTLNDVETKFIIQSNNFFGRAERWREFMKDPEEIEKQRQKEKGDAWVKRMCEKLRKKNDGI